LFHIIGRDKRDALSFRQKASSSCVVQHSKINLVMPGSGLGRVKTKSDLVVMPSGRQIFAFFCSPHDHRAQNSRCGDTARSFYTVRVKSGVLS